MLQLDETVQTWFCVCPRSLRHFLALDFIEVAPWVGLWIDRSSDALFYNDLRILATVRIDSWINTNRENVLMILCKNTRCNNVTVSTGFALVYSNDTDNTGCASLDGDISSKIKLVG